MSDIQEQIKLAHKIAEENDNLINKTRLNPREIQILLLEKDKEIERLNNIIEQIKEYIEYSLNNPLADERMILEMVLAKIKVELKGNNK